MLILLKTKKFNLNNISDELVRNFDSKNYDFDMYTSLFEIFNVNHQQGSACIFDIKEFVSIFPNINEIPYHDNLNYILEKKYMNENFVTDIEWSIAIINVDKDILFLNTIKQKYPNIKIKNVILFNHVFITKHLKLQEEYNVIDLNKEEENELIFFNII